jgi:hypothetical protein
MTLHGMLDLLYFAYLQSMGLGIVPYSLAGLFLSAVAGRAVEGKMRLPCVAFVLALFFSLSFVAGRLPVPVPTLFAAALWLVDSVRLAVNPPPCRPSSEGCIPPDQGDVFLIVPLLVQWALLYGVLATGSFIFRLVSPTNSTKTSNSHVDD